jgi:hypothetical protein
MSERTRSLLAAAVLTAISIWSAGAVAAQSEMPLDPMGASHWTGTWTETSGGNGLVTADDPRIAGAITESRDGVRVVSRDPGEGEVGFSSASVRIDNDGGAWVGMLNAFGGPTGISEWYTLVGEGGYEGLTAVFRWDAASSTFEGVILPAELPALPDPVPPPTE